MKAYPAVERMIEALLQQSWSKVDEED